MIDPHWSLVDLDPVTWRAIGPFFHPGRYIGAAQPGEHGLFVLHDGRRVLRVVDTASGVRRDLGLDEVGDPEALAARLFARGEWQRVHVINRQHLAAVAQAAQAHPRRDLTLDQYYRLVYHLIWGERGGYVSLPPQPGHWHGWTYEQVRAFVGALPDPASVALGVLDGADLRIGLVLDLRGGLIRTVTTFETFAFPAPAFDLSAAAFERLWTLLEARSRGHGTPPPAAALLCSQAAFDAWLTGADKAAVLEERAGRGEAFWRLPPDLHW
jgi:hypothetical protein